MNKKLQQHIRHELVRICSEKDVSAPGSVNEQLSSYRLLAFVVLVNFYEAYLVNNSIQLQVAFSPQQLSLLNSHFGAYYCQFYAQVRI